MTEADEESLWDDPWDEAWWLLTGDRGPWGGCARKDEIHQMHERIAEHDSRVRASVVKEAVGAIVDAAPPMNAELRMNVETGEAITDYRMAAYVEGFHDAWSAVQALANRGTE